METGLQYNSCCLCNQGNVLTLVFGGDYVCMRCIRDVMIPHIDAHKRRMVDFKVPYKAPTEGFNNEQSVAKALSGEAVATSDSTEEE